MLIRVNKKLRIIYLVYFFIQYNRDILLEYKIINIINNQNELFDIINLNQTNIDMVNKYTNAIISNNQKISEIYNNTNIKDFTEKSSPEDLAYIMYTSGSTVALKSSYEL